MAFTSFSLSRLHSHPFPFLSLSRPYFRFLDHWKPPILPKTPKSLLDYNPHTPSDDDDSTFTTMDRIVEKLKKFGYVDDPDPVKTPSLPEKGSVEDVFYSEDGDLPNGRGGIGEVRFPWEEERTVERRKERRTSVAELTIPETELRRLRHLAMRSKSKTKIGGGGVTKEVVDKIHEKWRTEEVVRLKCEGPPALNMKRMHEILERKTGGLVIWRSGSSISLYRGVTYEVPTPVKKQSSHSTGVGSLDRYSHNSISSPVEYNNENDVEGVAANAENSANTKATVEVKYEHEMDSLLDALGPRFTDWPGCDPLPVDADLLPTHIPNYKPPFRILPYGVRPHLGMKDQTALRRLARTLPPHFALGRSRQHQGLAAAMVKLWERSSIAKIALKRGVQLTTSERMAEEIKRLTGGTLLCRNKDFIVFYRGKDFLAPELTEALLERERLATELQDEEEQARVKASLSVFSNMVTPKESSTTGTLTETQEANARWGKQLDHDYKDKMARAADVARHADLVRKLERKLLLADKRLAKAEKALGKVEEFLKPAEQKPDPESISDEERYMFRKLGLKMKAFLLLGRRGVFDGTVENMHLHWKYRELVKILVKAKNFAQVKGVALSLEAESGGILVSVDKVSKGFAVIVYRGRDYQRPSTLRPKNLLTKRKALARSIELQRREALNQHISNMHKRVEQLRSELEQMETVKEHGDEELYAKLDSSYLSVDEDAEDDNDDDDDEAYLETYENGADYDNGYDNSDDEEEEDEQNSGGSLHSVLNRYNHEFSSQRNSPSPVLPGSDLQSIGE